MSHRPETRRRPTPPGWVFTLAMGMAVAGPTARGADDAKSATKPAKPVAAQPQAQQPAAVAAPAAQQSKDAAAADAAIALLEKRVAAAPTDASLPTQLAAQLLERVKQNQNYTLYARAQAACEEALKRDPDHVPAMLALGARHMARHRFADAVRTAEHVMAVRPDSAEALGLRGDALLELGELDRARGDYQELLDDRPGLLTHARMGRLQFAAGDAAAAIESLGKALEAGRKAGDPPPLVAWAGVGLGELHFRTGDWESAATCYEDALKAAPDDADALDHMAELHAARGEFEQAVALSDRAIAASPRPEFFHHRGDVHLAAKGEEQAFAWHDKALAAYLAAVEADNARYYHHLAGFLCDVDAFRDPARATQWARADLALRRTVPTLDALAWSLYHEGRSAEAAATMDKALRGPVADARVLYHAGLIYARAGNAAKGRQFLRRAADANPKFSEFHFHR